MWDSNGKPDSYLTGSYFLLPSITGCCSTSTMFPLNGHWLHHKRRSLCLNHLLSSFCALPFFRPCLPRHGAEKKTWGCCQFTLSTAFFGFFLRRLFIDPIRFSSLHILLTTQYVYPCLPLVYRTPLSVSLTYSTHSLAPLGILMPTNNKTHNGFTVLSG